MIEYRLIITGSRTFRNYHVLSQAVRKITEPMQEEMITVISAGQRGADQLGEQYAYERDWPFCVFPAEKKKYGESAPQIRNQAMALYAVEPGCQGFLISFWDMRSSETRKMIKTARKFGLETYVFDFKGNPIFSQI